MKADKAKMFPVALTKLKAEDGAPFPLYLLLRRNSRYVPIRLPGDPIGLQKFEHFLQKEHGELWVPDHFQDIFRTYLEYQESTGHPVPDMAAAEALLAQPSAAPCEEALLVAEALADEDLSTEEKAEILTAVSQDMLRALNQITTRGDAARSEGLKRCKDIADEILSVAAKNSNIYDEILALRNSQEDFEHSVIVGTMAAMFGMAVGFTDERLLADLTVAAIFHDIGMVRVKPEVIAKPAAAWTAEDRSSYEGHVEASVAILRESGADFHPRVYRMMQEHHECYDGSGFPKKLQGAAIDEPSGLLALANLFDRLCTGKEIGKEFSPAEAFDYIYESSGAPEIRQQVQPELVTRVFQFMLNEKTAADELRQAAEARTAEAIKQNV